MSVTSSSSISSTAYPSSIAEPPEMQLNPEDSRIEQIRERSVSATRLQDLGNGLELIGASTPSSDTPQEQAMEDRENEHEHVRHCYRLENCCAFLQWVCNASTLCGLFCITTTAETRCPRLGEVCIPFVVMSTRASRQIGDFISRLDQNR